MRLFFRRRNSNKVTPMKTVSTGLHDLDASYCAALQSSNQTDLAVIDWDGLLRNCSNDPGTIRYMFEECSAELQDSIVENISKFSKTGQLKKVQYLLEKTLGIANYMYALRLVKTTEAYLLALSSVLSADELDLEDLPDEEHLSPGVHHFLASMNKLLSNVIMETISVFPWSFSECRGPTSPCSSSSTCTSNCPTVETDDSTVDIILSRDSNSSRTTTKPY